MKNTQPTNTLMFRFFIVLFLIAFTSNAQIIQVEIIGGAVVTDGSTVTINAGDALDFKITNISSGCTRLRVDDITIGNTTDFDLDAESRRRDVRSSGCNNWKKYSNFEVENVNASCVTASTTVTVELRDDPDFTFTLQVNSSPVISVLGGSPSADILNTSTTTTDTNGTYFGVIDEGALVTRNFIVSNTGSCALDISSITASTSVPSNGFSLDGFMFSPTFTPLPYTASIDPGSYAIFRVHFTGPIAGSGTLTSTISISNSDNTTFTFDVSAEMFDFNIPGPGGITADFRLWLKSTRGIVTSGTSLTDWNDLGSNGKDATADSGKEPTYLDTATDNINFNPVVKFENDGGATEQYMYNSTNGFYSQDIFIVMIPDATMTSASTGNTIFAGVSSGSAGDMTGVGLGDYSSEFTNETLSYNQDIPGGGSYNGEAEISSTYSNAGIINIRNNAASSPTGQDILYNSNVLTTSFVNDIAFANVGSPGPPTILGTEYWIGRNFDAVGSLNGRVAEIFTFAERVTDADRQKIESYLAIKYGITLGASTEAQKDYINSFNTSVWDISANTGYNYHVAGIGRDSISDLNQKQSKTLNTLNEVCIGLGGLYTTNSVNTNEFKKDGDFLVWGNNDAAFTSSGSNTITIASGITTSLTRILRQWKIVESTEDVDGDVENIFVSIPSAVFASFTLGADEEYALIVADNDNFANGDIIDVIPLKSDGGSNLQTWYDFDGTKYFTFGKVSKLTENRTVNIESGDYLVGEYALNLNIEAFTISAWIKSASSANTRTIMAKGEKLQLRLNSSDQVEVMVDDTVTPRFTSTMTLDDGKWHQVTFVYKSGTIFLYVDGVLDKSEHDVEPPTPNFNRFSLGALYVDKNNITNPFLGEIDEVYVWDQELTQDQVRYLMNQEVERFNISGTDYVDGKIIPQASASNEIATIPWSNLKAYYDFNSFYGSTVEGLTDERNFIRLKYLSKDKDFTDAQTGPFPYVSAANGAWDTGTTWSNNADQVIPNSVSLDGTTIIDWNIVEISHDITSGDRDISLLGLKQTTGNLIIADPVVTFPAEDNSGQALTISHYLELDGVIDLVGESQLIQTEGSIIDADSGGYIERDQQGTKNGFNYNYWSSSVGPISGNTATRGTGASSTNTNHSIVDILKNGTDSDGYSDLNFDSSPSGGTIPPPGLARTISTYWLYKFYGDTNDYNAWESIDETTSLLAGDGFTMKGTSGTAPISEQQNYVFKGLPNNGDITLTLDKSSGEVDRLIGNPYPSAIDATEFILDNMSIADGGNNATGTVFNGALYFWDHFGEENSHNLGEYVGGYATRNLTGGAVAISNDSRINNTSNAGSAAIGTKIPGEYIPVNQGFFVSTALDGFDNDNGVAIPTVDGGDIVFKNSQRVYATEDGVTSIFLKSSSKKGVKTIAPKIDDIPRIKLMYSSPSGYHRQIVLGASQNASADFDMGYDAFMPDVNKEDMYWILNNSKLVIQGVNNFNSSQEFPLGLKVSESGIASIKVDEIENVNNASLYIKDSNTDETYKINNNSFDIVLEPGEYKDRFKLVFQSSLTGKSLSIDEVDDIDNSILTYYDSKVSKLKIVNKYGVYISSINLYNILGQEVKAFDLNSSKDESVSLTVKTGAYIIKFNTENGIVNKKIIIE